MKNLSVFFASFVAVALLCNLPITGEEKKQKPAFDMKKKLEYSQGILDGLVTEDFDKILKNAKLLNKLGEHNWTKNESADYRTQNQVFWFTAGTLVLAAKDENIDGATLSYTQMTLSCVNCHKLIRKK